MGAGCNRGYPANGQFNSAEGIAVHPNGNIYVADVYNYRIQEFTSSGAYVTQWGSGGTGNSKFEWPYGIAVNAGGYTLCR